jgi:hypothetical protein
MLRQPREPADPRPNVAIRADRPPSPRQLQPATAPIPVRNYIPPWSAPHPRRAAGPRRRACGPAGGEAIRSTRHSDRRIQLSPFSRYTRGYDNNPA